MTELNRISIEELIQNYENLIINDGNVLGFKNETPAAGTARESNNY